MLAKLLTFWPPFATARTRRAAWAALGLIVATATPVMAKDPKPVPVYGPAPEWQRYRELGEAAVRENLVDPDSAKIRWPNGYVQRGYTPFLSKRVNGYANCGFVNARNRMGGYAGEVPFALVIDDDQVLFIEVAEAKSQSFMRAACAKGAFPPASAMTAAATRSGPRFAFALTSVPDGAYVSTVTPGSAASAAGITSGMVIARLNGVALKGMGLSTIEQMLAGADGSVTLDMIGGKSVRVAKELVDTPHPRPAELERGGFADPERDA